MKQPHADPRGALRAAAKPMLLIAGLAAATWVRALPVTSRGAHLAK